jgi:7-carboxy-7-deazaguanine synthase
MSVSAIIKEVLKTRIKNVLLTGGEPLEQRTSYELIKKMIDKGLKVTVETNGALPVRGIHRKATTVMDVKPPSQKSRNKTLTSNFKHLRKSDLVKIVLSSESDYKWAKKYISK